MIPLRDIMGGLLVLAIWIMLLGLSSLATAATLQPGQSLTVECKAGSTPPPKPTPPPSGNCPKPEFPTTVDKLVYGKDKDGIVLNAGKALAYRFLPRDLHAGVTSITIGPHFAQGSNAPSNMNTMTMSRCPGDFDIQKLGRACYGAGGQSSMDIVVDRSSLGACTVSGARVPHYLNITPMNPITRRSSCKGNCGAIVSVR